MSRERQPATGTCLPPQTADPMHDAEPQNPLYLFACVRPELQAAIGQELRASNLRVMVTSNPREIRDLAAEHVVAAVLLDEGFDGPAPEELATAFAAGLPRETAFLLLVDELGSAARPPFDAVVRIPCGHGVLRDVVMRAVSLRWTDLEEPVRSMVEELEARADMMTQQNHYEVLGLPEGVHVDAIVAAFDQLSLRLHPERLRAQGGSSDLAHEVYGRICEAYRTLRTPGSREAYDIQLRSKGGAEAGASQRPLHPGQSLEELSTHPIARRHLRIAQQALAVRDTAMAIAQIRFAASKDPDNALIPAQLVQLEERLKGATEHG